MLYDEQNNSNTADNNQNHATEGAPDYSEPYDHVNNTSNRNSTASGAQANGENEMFYAY